jgi:adenylate cyclase
VGTRKNHGILGYAGSVCCAILALFISQTLPLAQLESFSQDQRIARLTPVVVLDPSIVIVSISAKTFERLPKRLPIDRAFLANLITAIDNGQPRAIGVDILLDRPTTEAADAHLRRTMAAVQAPLVLASTGQTTPFESSFLASSHAYGTPHLIADSQDGVLRRMDVGRKTAPGFTMQLARVAGKMSAPSGGIYALPLNTHGRSPFPTISAEAVLNKSIDREVFRNRIILIGADLPDTDRHLTPLAVLGPPHDAGMAGVQVHAYQLRTLLGRTNQPKTYSSRDLLLCLATAVVGYFLGRAAISTSLRLLGFMLIAPSISLLCFAIFPSTGWLANSVAATLAFSVSLGFSVAKALTTSRQHAIEITNSFSRFLEPDLVQFLVQNPSLAHIGAEPREIAVLFTDIADFTAMVDRLPPEHMTRLLNDYLRLVTQTIIHYGGTIDKISGDSVHALFGAPISQSDAAAQAAHCVIALDTATAQFQADNAKFNFGITRIGAHFGTAIVGIFGSDMRLDYTAHGSVMNLGARLEQANKSLGTSTCVSIDIARSLPEVWMPVGDLALRGVASVVKAYTRKPPGLNVEAYEAALHIIESAPSEALARLRTIGSAHPVIELHIRRLTEGLATLVIDLA